ncbi:unnamed protein product, partial [Larinioides sclopetarius]
MLIKIVSVCKNFASLDLVEGVLFINQIYNTQLHTHALFSAEFTAPRSNGSRPDTTQNAGNSVLL